MQRHTENTETEIEEELMKNHRDGVGLRYAETIAEERVAYERRVRHGTLQHTRRLHGDDVGEDLQLLPEDGIRNLETAIPSAEEMGNILNRMFVRFQRLLTTTANALETELMNMWHMVGHTDSYRTERNDARERADRLQVEVNDTRRNLRETETEVRNVQDARDAAPARLT